MRCHWAAAAAAMGKKKNVTYNYSTDADAQEVGLLNPDDAVSSTSACATTSELFLSVVLLA